MPRTPTLPPTDPRMWRRVLARLHPDSGGAHELFLWGTVVRDLVCGDGHDARHDARHDREPAPPPPPPPPADDKPRVLWDEGDDFEEVTKTALGMGAVGMPYGRLLSLLADCRPLANLAHEQQRGASYKRLAAIGHMWGMTKAERVKWYRVAEDLPLSDRHAGHILARLKRRAA